MFMEVVMNVFVNKVKGEVVVDDEVYVSGRRVEVVVKAMVDLVNEWLVEKGGEEKVDAGALLVMREVVEWMEGGLLEKYEMSDENVKLLKETKEEMEEREMWEELLDVGKWEEEG